MIVVEYLAIMLLVYALGSLLAKHNHDNGLNP